MINIDTGTAFTFISEGSPTRQQLKNFVGGRQMVMTQTAYSEFTRIVSISGGPLEQARAVTFLKRVTIIPDNPSARAWALKRTGNVKNNDIIIFGTADNLGIPTMTTDASFVRATRAQGINFDVYEHNPQSLTGR